VTRLCPHRLTTPAAAAGRPQPPSPPFYPRRAFTVTNHDASNVETTNNNSLTPIT